MPEITRRATMIGSVAYDATHGFSHQYLVELDVVPRCRDGTERRRSPRPVPMRPAWEVKNG